MDIIVATGDVTLNADFTGTIVAKGRIIVNKDQCEIDNGTQEVFKVMQTMHCTCMMCSWTVPTIWVMFLLFQIRKRRTQK